MPRRTERNYRLIIWPAVAVVLLDQATKLTVLRCLKVHESIPVIRGFFNLVHVRNRGMAFGFMNRVGSEGAFWFLVSVSVVAIFLLCFWFFRLREDQTTVILGLSLIWGGAVGNLIDRLRLREVVDFLDFYIGPYHWPAFNVADAAITTGTFLVAVTLLFRR